MFKLGSKLKSKVTGFVGIATSKTEYLNGCVRYGLTPRVDKDGKIQDIEFVDIQELEEIEKKAVMVNARPTDGGPNPPAM